MFLAAACKAVVTKQVRWTTRGSTPSRPRNGPFVYRFRTPAPHAGKAGSIPARVTDNSQVVELVYTRRSERRALAAWEFDSPLGHCERTSQVSQCSAGPHKPATAGCDSRTCHLMTGYANWKSDEVESLVICGFDSHLGHCRSRGPTAKTPGRHPGKRWFNSIRDHLKLVCRCFGGTPPR